MVAYVYLGIFVISALYLRAYLRRFSKQQGIHYIAYLLLVTFSALNFYLLSTAECVEVADLARKNIYSVMLFVPIIFLCIVCELCNVSERIFKDIFLIFAIVLIALNVTGVKQGFVHQFFYVYLAVAQFTTFFILVKNCKKNNVPVISLMNLAAMEIILFASAFVSRLITIDFSFYPVGEVIVAGMMLKMVKRVPLYDVNSSVIERIEQDKELGVAIADNKQRLLGYNKAMVSILPEFEKARVDVVLPKNLSCTELIEDMATQYAQTKTPVKREIQIGEKWYSFEMSSLVYNSKNSGYQIFARDITEKTRYIKQLEIYREELMHEVDEKVTEIDRMKDATLLGIAELIESRDGSTGGHVKRTSHVVNILTENLANNYTFDVSPLFYAIVEKMAPLHDVGKVAVDDAILRKPGKLTDEEFAQMKNHTVSGGAIINKILKGINNKEWISIATNMATYHHEKWDGTGYPNNLVGTEIPLEARIMAVADVYDALVSARCYKEGLSFDQVYNIIMDGMGTQFDPALGECFKECAPKLEAYYSELRGKQV